MFLIFSKPFFRKNFSKFQKSLKTEVYPSIKAKSKIGSLNNVKHKPGGGNVKIETQKLKIEPKSKIGSMDNVKHKPQGGNVKIQNHRIR